MAKVTMDISELKAMEKHAASLEEALAREIVLNERIRELEAEKMEALESAKMKVIIEKKVKTKKVEVKLLAKDPETILSEFTVFMERLQYMKRSVAWSPNEIRDALSDFIKRIFRSDEILVLEDPEITRTTQGLDEVISSLKADLERKMKLDFDAKERALSEAITELKEARKQLKIRKVSEEELFKLTKKIVELENTEKHLRALLSTHVKLRHAAWDLARSGSVFSIRKNLFAVIKELDASILNLEDEYNKQLKSISD